MSKFLSETAVRNMTERLHFSTTREVTLRNRKPGPKGHGLGIKPVGLWYSIGAEWLDWCVGQEFQLHRLAHVFKVTLDMGRILELNSNAKIRTFYVERGRPIAPGLQMLDFDWRAVGNRYHGIEINPYPWDMRQAFDAGSLMISAWDVASGCVWNMDAVKRFDYLGELELDMEKVEDE